MTSRRRCRSSPGRVATLVGLLASAVAALESTIATIPADGIVDDPGDAAALAQAVYALDPFGIPLEPWPERPLDVSWVRDAWHGADARRLNAQASVNRLTALPATTPASLVLDAAQEVASAVFGDGFLVVPLLEADDDSFVGALTNPAFASPSAGTLRRFVRDLATVRRQVARFSEALLLGGALGQSRTLRVVQLSERTEAGLPAEGTTHWLAGALPAEGPWPASPVAHIVLEQLGTVDAGAAVAGLVVDAWVEDLPAQPGPKADPNDPRPGRARTGLAIRSNSASSRPPQAVLSAVSPDGKRWTTDSLRKVIEQTLELAQVRMVTLERLAGEGLVLPALYTRSSSLQGQQYLEFSKLAELSTSLVVMPFVKELKT